MFALAESHMRDASVDCNNSGASLRLWDKNATLPH